MAQIEKTAKQTRIRQSYRPEGSRSPRAFIFFTFAPGRVPDDELTILCEEVQKKIKRYNSPRSKIVLTAIKIELWASPKVLPILCKRKVIT